jgi:transcriptional regulator with XRE-family HTH domain
MKKTNEGVARRLVGELRALKAERGWSTAELTRQLNERGGLDASRPAVEKWVSGTSWPGACTLLGLRCALERLHAAPVGRHFTSIAKVLNQKAGKRP